MNQRTEKALTKLSELEWFSNVGEKNCRTAKVVSGWEDVKHLIPDDMWQDLRQEGSNDYTKKLFAKNKGEGWSETLVLLRPIISQLISIKIKDRIGYNMPEYIAETVEFDVLLFLMEMEFSDIIAPGFYTNHMMWYFKGHFPCGWEWKNPPQEGWLIEDLSNLGRYIIY